MRWLVLTCLILGAILATKSEINEEEQTLAINGFESKEQNIENRIEEGDLEIQNIAENENGGKKKAAKKKNGNKKLLKEKRPNSNGNKLKKQKKQRNKITKTKKRKKKKEKKAKNLRNKNGKRKGKGKGRPINKDKKKKKKHKKDKKKRRKQIKIKKRKKKKERNIKHTDKKTEKIKSKRKKERAKKGKNKKKFKKERAKKGKNKKKIKKKKKKTKKNNKKSFFGNEFIKEATQMSCDEIILSRIKLERKAVNYMRQFNRSKRFMGKTDNKLKKKNIWLKSSEKQDPISLLIKCGGDDESNLKCAGSTSNKNSVMMTTLLSNLRNCTPNIGSECHEGKFPAKEAAFDQCAAHLMAYQAKSQECLKKDGAGACACYLTTEAIKLYDNGKACDAPKMQQYERKVLKTKDNCVSKFKDCRKYQDELAVVMMTCCGEGGECPA